MSEPIKAPASTVDHSSRIGLGTAQFGLNYGISNLTGKTPIKDVTEILQYCFQNNISTIDTAHTYGDSEQAIGLGFNSKLFDVITKTIPTFQKEIRSDQIKIVCDGVFESLRRLRLDRLYGLLVHHCEDLANPGGDLLFKSLNEIKSKGFLSKIGVSVYSIEEIEFILENYEVDLIQIPMNVFDQRLLRSGMLQRIKNSGIEIHVRSAFLQGVVFMEPKNLPLKMANHSVHLTNFQLAIQKLGISPISACLAFLMQQPEIDKVICGVNSLSQLKELIETASILPLIDRKFFDTLAVEDENFLNPSNW